jgi:pyruvate dehydrogenase E2 component (dihydrolipoamide acetyltransferase)
MPSLGADMEAGTLVEWLKHEGDEVHRGDIIAVVETQKGAIEVEVFEDGPLTRLLVPPGSKVAVGTPLALIGGAEAAEFVPTPVPSAPAAPAQVPNAAPPFPPAAPLPAGGASPAARRLAQERGVGLGAVHGTGAGGGITLADVEAAIAVAPPGSPMRAAIAAAMTRSKREIPHYYLTHRFDISPAVAAVEEHNRGHAPEERLLLATLLIKAVARAVCDFPEMNGFHEEGRRVESKAIHVGVAIAMRGGGLAAPAIHHTDRLSLPNLMKQMQDLVGRVRQGKFKSSEVSDPTITVSSLGDRGVEALLPIIYPPQVAIVGFGSPAIRPWVYRATVEPRHVIGVSLAADHRVSDGHSGTLFLRRIADLLERPETL